jgi:phospholipase/carboxylesterase
VTVTTPSRRHFVTLMGGAAVSLVGSSACGMETFSAQAGDGRLSARPRANGKTTASGRSALLLGDVRDGVLVLPSTVAAAPLPLIVLLHGAGGAGDRLLTRFGSSPSDAGVAVLALDSRRSTWDGIRDGFGPDVAFLDRALNKVFGIVAVDPERLAIGGFSDGATYALSLGLINGDLFRKIVAFSPGFVVERAPHGKPHVFISHGTADNILPIDQCSRVIVPQLRKRGYDVTFREFAGGHEVPAAIGAEGFKWVAAPATEPQGARHQE